jgi:hypothetical protein
VEGWSAARINVCPSHRSSAVDVEPGVEIVGTVQGVERMNDAVDLTGLCAFMCENTDCQPVNLQTKSSTA